MDGGPQPTQPQPLVEGLGGAASQVAAARARCLLPALGTRLDSSEAWPGCNNLQANPGFDHTSLSS